MELTKKPTKIPTEKATVPPWYIQFRSARWWLTIMAGFVFIYCSVERVLGVVEIMAILMLIFQSYFQRSDREGEKKV